MIFYWAQGGGDADIIPGEHGVTIEINNPEGATWQIQLIQGEFSLQTGVSYTMSFDAMASHERSIEAMIEKSADPWIKYNEVQNYSLTTEFQTFSHSFTMNGPTQPLRWAFNLAGQEGNVSIKNVSLIVGD